MKQGIQLEWFDLGEESRGAHLGDWALQVTPPDPERGRAKWRWAVLAIDSGDGAAQALGEADGRYDAQLVAEAKLWARLAALAHVSCDPGARADGEHGCG